MDRYPGSTRDRWGLLALIITLSLATGCVRALATAVYLVKGTNTSAEFKGLKGKRIAVVCRPLVELRYSSSGASSELARSVGDHLKNNLRRVHIVDQQRVAEWTDENTWDDFTEVGQALDADLVLGIDLEHFETLRSQTLYQGTAQVKVTVYDIAADTVIWEKKIPQYVYPPNTAIPTSEKPEAEFRRQFINKLADQIGRHFYDHDTGVDVAGDVSAVLD